MPSALPRRSGADTNWPMNTRLSERRRAAVSTGAVPSASAERSCSTACARSSKRSKWGASDSARAGPTALATLAAAASSCGVSSRTDAAARCASSAASRPSSTAWVCSSSVDQPSAAAGQRRRRLVEQSLRAAPATRRARRTPGPSRAPRRPPAAGCSATARRAWPHGRAAATAGARPGPTAAAPQPRSAAATSATSDQRGLQPGGIESVRHGSCPIRLRRPRSPGIRKPPPAGRPDSRAGSAR